MACVTLNTLNRDVVGFDPRSVGGCVLWLDGADAGTITFSSGTSVDSWRDKSGLGNNASYVQRTSGPNAGSIDTTRPTYNSAGKFVSFARASAQYLTTTASSSTPIETLFAVITTNGNGGARTLVGGSPLTGKRQATAQDNSLAIGSQNVAGVTSFSTTIGTTATLMTYTMPGTVGSQSVVGANITGFRNGTSLTPTSPATSTFNTGGVTWVGAQDTNNLGTQPDNFYQGNIYEILIFQGVIPTTQQRQAIEGYLAWKWGLQSSLPAMHPFRATFPRAAFFNPLSIPDCNLWIDAADPSSVTTSGSSVTAVSDKSGRGNNSTIVANITYLANGINGLNVFSFPGTAIAGANRIFGTIANTTSTVSAFIVCQIDPTGSANFARVLSCSINSQSDFNTLSSFTMTRNGTTNTVVTQRVTVLDPSAGISFTSNTPFLWANIFDGTNRQQFFNGTGYVVSAQSGNFGYTRYGIGDGAGSTLGAMKGYVGEVLIYNRGLSGSERQQVEGYLSQKWGLRTNLPTTQPFRSALLPQSPLFLPNQLTTTPTGWFDGRDPNNNVASIPENAATLATWTDKSGNANNGTGGVSPTYSKTLTGVTFNGSTQFLTTPIPAYLGSETIFCVLTFSAVADRYIFATSASAGGRFLGVTASKLACGNVNTNFGATITSPLLTANVKMMFTYVCTSGSPNNTTQLYLYHPNGSSSASAALVAYSGTSTTNIGNNVNNGYFPGTIHELIIVPATLGLNEIQRTEGYLAWKWSINNLLPTTHPYRKIKP